MEIGFSVREVVVPLSLLLTLRILIGHNLILEHRFEYYKYSNRSWPPCILA
jgi:hypothetical protein